MPAGPTASEAAEIILLLVDVPFLRSSLCVRFCCPVLLAVLSPARCAHWTKSTPANLDTPGKGRLRLLCDRDTRGTAKSSFPRYRTLDLPAYHSALLDSPLRTCAIATERSQLPSELTSGVLLRRWVTSTHKSRPHRHALWSSGMQHSGRSHTARFQKRQEIFRYIFESTWAEPSTSSARSL